MDHDFKSWGVYHYRRKGKRLIATLVKVFDSAKDARLLMQDWRAKGPVYVGPCDVNAKITPQGKRMFTNHGKLLRPCGKVDRTDVNLKFNHQAGFNNA